MWSPKVETYTFFRIFPDVFGRPWNTHLGIIPVSKWLVTPPPYKPFSPFGRGITLLRGLTITMVIKHLLTGVILQDPPSTPPPPPPKKKTTTTRNLLGDPILFSSRYWNPPWNCRFQHSPRGSMASQWQMALTLFDWQRLWVWWWHSWKGHVRSEKSGYPGFSCGI